MLEGADLHECGGGQPDGWYGNGLPGKKSVEGDRGQFEQEHALFDARRSARTNRCMGAGSAVHPYGGVNGKTAQAELVQEYLEHNGTVAASRF